MSYLISAMDGFSHDRCQDGGVVTYYAAKDLMPEHS
jgi:hypothetical protein